MLAITRLLYYANSRSLRTLSFVLRGPRSIALGSINISLVCLCILPNLSFPALLYNQNILLRRLGFDFLKLLAELVDIIVLRLSILDVSWAELRVCKTQNKYLDCQSKSVLLINVKGINKATSKNAQTTK